MTSTVHQVNGNPTQRSSAGSTIFACRISPASFRALYNLCEPNFASDFHRQPGGLGRKEFFADAFAAIASRQRPALVDMLNGDTRTALQVMLYFNRRYGI